MPPAIVCVVPLSLVTESAAAGVTVAVTVAMLFVALVSLVPAVGVSVTVFVSVVNDETPEISPVTVTVQVEPASALVIVPLIRVLEPTVLVTAEHDPPPEWAAASVNTGVIVLGKVSLKVADPVPPTLVLAKVNT